MKNVRTAALALLVIAAIARGQTVDGALAEAVAAADAKKVEAAAKAFGLAAAIAHKANDLLAEHRVAGKLGPFLQTLDDAPRADALALVALALDRKRAGAFVSARTIAGELIMLATRTGNTAHAAEASAILAAQSAAPKSGKATRTLAAYAKGMELVAANKRPQALAPLETALTGAVAEGWADLAFHAGTELAAQAVAAGNVPKATTALSLVASVFPATVDQDLVQSWRKLVKARLEAAPPEVLAPFTEAMKPFGGSTSVSAAGGAGGAGGPGGVVSDLGRAWGKLAPTQAFVSVKRLDDGFEIGAPFDPALKTKQPLKPGLVHVAERGLTLSFRGRGVALNRLDLEALQGAPGGTSSLPPGIPLYHLAKGETWSVSRQGVVTISG